GYRRSQPWPRAVDDRADIFSKTIDPAVPRVERARGQTRDRRRGGDGKVDEGVIARRPGKGSRTSAQATAKALCQPKSSLSSRVTKGLYECRARRHRAITIRLSVVRALGFGQNRAVVHVVHVCGNGTTCDRLA